MEGRGMGISEKVSESLLAQLDRLEAVDASVCSCAWLG